MANLKTIRKTTTSTNDRYFAEPLLLSFITNGLADKEQHKRVIYGILTVNDESIKKSDGSTINNWKVNIAGSSAILTIDRSKYPDIVIRRDDKIQAYSREGQPWFKVAAVNSRSLGRLYVNLVEA